MSYQIKLIDPSAQRNKIQGEDGSWAYEPVQSRWSPSGATPNQARQEIKHWPSDRQWQPTGEIRKTPK